jgi:hypothetical protein
MNLTRNNRKSSEYIENPMIGLIQNNEILQRWIYIEPRAAEWNAVAI